MKTPAIITSVVLLGAALSLTAGAATGRPSEAQAGSEAACVVADAPIDAGQDAQVGSYARYLMLNGKPRERAIAEARNIDRRAPLQVAAQRAAPPQTAETAADHATR